MQRILNEECNADLLSPLALAFVGDTVFDLYVRESLVCAANRSAKQLHNVAVTRVCAAAQAELVCKIMPMLSEKELAVFKRGRNAHTNHIPKNASERDYHYATGLEALVGWLYLSGYEDRLREIMSYCEI